MSAVTITLWLLVTLPVTASNVVLLWPAGTVTLTGTESKVLLLAMDTTESVAAAAVKLKVHLPALWPVIADGEHEIDLERVFRALNRERKALGAPV